jgi:hypothetical protein
VIYVRNHSTRQPARTGNFSAADIKRQMAEREAAKAAEGLRRTQDQEERQRQ